MSINQAVLDGISEELRAVIDSYLSRCTQEPEALAVVRSLECAVAYAMVEIFGLRDAPPSRAKAALETFRVGLGIRISELRERTP